VGHHQEQSSNDVRKTQQGHEVVKH
jgi:hypothetical protein